MMRWFYFLSTLWIASACTSGQYTTLDRVHERGVITFGVDPNNLPFSSSTNQPPGFDIEIAQKLAEHLGVSFKPVWVLSQHPSFPSQLTKKKCDALMGVLPAALAGEKGIDFTNPYYSTGFRMAVPRHFKQRFLDARGKTVGIEAGVVAQKLQGHVPREFPNQLAILQAVDKEEVFAGYVGAVQAGWLLKNHAELKVRLADGFVPQDRWNVVIAVRKDDPELKSALNRLIQEMLHQHEFASIFDKYGIPFYPPFE